MSSPIHHAKDLDAALVYAPPWARGQTRSATQPLGTAPAEPPGDETGPVFSGDRAMLELQCQLALDPEGVPEPPTTAAQTLWPMMRRLSIVGCGAALVTSAMMWVIGARPAANTTVAAVLAPSAAFDRGDKDQMSDAWPPPATVPAHQVAANPTVPAAIGAITIASSTESIMAPAVVPPKPAPAKPDNSATLQLGGAEIAMLVKRGRDYLGNGDFASARLLLRRAAQAGSADAALALGTTFDPLVIRRLGAIGAAPDAAKARKWYRKAAELGSDDALQHLAALGQE